MEDWDVGFETWHLVRDLVQVPVHISVGKLVQGSIWNPGRDSVWTSVCNPIRISIEG